MYRVRVILAQRQEHLNPEEISLLVPSRLKQDDLLQPRTEQPSRGPPTAPTSLSPRTQGRPNRGARRRYA